MTATCRYCNGLQRVYHPDHRLADKNTRCLRLCVLLREEGICPLQIQAAHTTANDRLAEAVKDLAATLRETAHPAAKPILEILAPDLNGRSQR